MKKSVINLTQSGNSERNPEGITKGNLGREDFIDN